MNKTVESIIKQISQYKEPFVSKLINQKINDTEIAQLKVINDIEKIINNIITIEEEY